MLSLFPEDEHAAIRQSLVFSLRAIITQKLVPSAAEGIRRVPAVEILRATPIVQKLIGEGRTDARGIFEIRSMFYGKPGSRLTAVVEREGSYALTSR